MIEKLGVNWIKDNETREVAKKLNELIGAYNNHAHFYDQPRIEGGIDGAGQTSEPLPAHQPNNVNEETK